MAWVAYVAHLRHGQPSHTGSLCLGDLDLTEYLDRFQGQRLVLVIAPLGRAEPQAYTYDICGFVMSEAGECPRCKLAVQQEAAELEVATARGDIFDQVDELMRDLDGNGLLDSEG